MKCDSPVKKFPGYVVLPEYLNLRQVRRVESALDGLADIKQPEGGKTLWFGVIEENRLPVVLECVQEWHIEGIPEKPTIETFPLTPASDAADLLRWLFEQIRNIWIGETEIPNG